MITVLPNTDSATICGYQVELHPLTEEDLEQVLIWRNSDFVRQQMLQSSIISAQDHCNWFDRQKHDPSQCHWIVRYKGQAIGVTNVKAINSHESVNNATDLAPGLYIGEPKYQNNIVAFAPTLALYDYCFTTLNAVTMRAVVKAQNKPALKYNTHLGYEIGSQGAVVELYLQKLRYQRQNELLKKMLSRPKQLR